MENQMPDLSEVEKVSKEQVLRHRVNDVLERVGFATFAQTEFNPYDSSTFPKRVLERFDDMKQHKGEAQSAFDEVWNELTPAQQEKLKASKDKHANAVANLYTVSTSTVTDAVENVRIDPHTGLSTLKEVEEIGVASYLEWWKGKQGKDIIIEYCDLRNFAAANKLMGGQAKVDEELKRFADLSIHLSGISKGEMQVTDPNSVEGLPASWFAADVSSEQRKDMQMELEKQAKELHDKGLSFGFYRVGTRGDECLYVNQSKGELGKDDLALLQNFEDRMFHVLTFPGHFEQGQQSKLSEMYRNHVINLPNQISQEKHMGLDSNYIKLSNAIRESVMLDKKLEVELIEKPHRLRMDYVHSDFDMVSATEQMLSEFDPDDLAANLSERIARVLQQSEFLDQKTSKPEDLVDLPHRVFAQMVFDYAIDNADGRVEVLAKPLHTKEMIIKALSGDPDRLYDLGIQGLFGKSALMSLSIQDRQEVLLRVAEARGLHI